MADLPTQEAFETLAREHTENAAAYRNFRLQTHYERHMNSATACRIAAKVVDRELFREILEDELHDGWRESQSAKQERQQIADAIIAYLVKQDEE